MKIFLNFFLLFGVITASTCENLKEKKWFDLNRSCIKREDITIITVTHGGRSDSFWDVVEDAVVRAGKDLGVNSIYRTPEVFDLDAMNALILRAIEENPDGLIVRSVMAFYLSKTLKKKTKDPAVDPQNKKLALSYFFSSQNLI